MKKMGWALHNFDLLFLLGFALFAAIRGFVVDEASLIELVITAFLGMLAISQLISRYQISAIARTLRHSRTALLERDFPQQYQDAQRAVTDSYFYVGRTMGRTFPVMTPHIQRILENPKGIVRIVLPDPRNKALMQMIASTRVGKSPSQISTSIALTLENALTTGNTSRVEVRTVSFLPSIGINGWDTERGEGSIMVQEYEFCPEKEASPVFFLEHSDRLWFEHYKNQFERIWKNSSPYQVDPTPTQQSS